YVTALVFARDGKYLVAGHSNRALGIYDVASGELKRTVQDFQTYMVQSLALSQDGTVLAGGISNGQVRLWELAKTAESATQPEYWQQNDPTGATHFVALSPDNRTLLRGGADGLKLYPMVLPGANFQVSAPRRVIPSPAPAVRYTCAAFSSDGKTLVAGGTDGIIRLWDPDNGESLGTYKGHQGEIPPRVFRPLRHQLASASADDTVHL